MVTINMKIGRTNVRMAICALACLLAMGCSLSEEIVKKQPGAVAPQLPQPSTESCASWKKSFSFPNTEIKSAKTILADTVKIGGAGVAEHCQVLGAMHKRLGADGRTYEIGFEMRLPKDWNGRFYYQANGGLDGVVSPAFGTLGGGPVTGALSEGFAVISSDAGHIGAQTSFFGAEPQARLDYGYQAVQKLAPMAKALIEHTYGKKPHHSYIGGCSNGGRHALVAASRTSHEFDGYLAGAPGYRLPNAALAQLWGAQQWSAIATAGATIKHPMRPNAVLPDLASALTPVEASYVGNRILEKCDALDGLKDGLIHSVQACQTQFSINKDIATCATDRHGACLTSLQKSTLHKIMQGGSTETGKPIYSSFPFDAGIAGADWSKWKFINSLVLDPLAVATVFSSPPDSFDPMTLNMDSKLENFSATTGVYQESALSFMTPPQNENPVNLRALKAKGAKIMVFHGVSDPIFSAEDTRQWYERVNRVENGKASDFVAYFPVPGMNHCSGGPAADQFDLLGPLVHWVEEGKPPTQVQSTARTAGNPGGENKELASDWGANRTRPLCPYPKIATYRGRGSTEDMRSFVCQE
jgi:poly(3-hydroxybutyrate) depolymerase